MTTLNIYPHLITQGIEGELDMGLAFRSIDTAQHTANLLVKLFNGKAKMSGDGSQTVQFDDTVEINRKLNEKEQLFIKNAFPFVSIVEPYSYQS